MTAGALLATLFTVSTAAADSNVQKVIDETYVQPEYVLGYSLDESQKQQTLQMLGYNSSSDSKPLKTMTPEVYSKIMDVANDSSLQLYSSVKIQKLGSNKPLEVKIVTPQNITKVTEDMYRNAAVTLGVQHAQITVAAPIPVTGESALAGIYSLSGINAENTGKEGYDADKLNVALADIKAATANAKKNNSNLTADDLRKIVEETLKNYGLTQSVTSDQINLIVNFAINLSNSGVITDSDFTKTLSDLKDSIVSKAGDTFNNINLNFDANGLLQEGGNFFSNIWNAIVNFFKGLFGG